MDWSRLQYPGAEHSVSAVADWAVVLEGPGRLCGDWWWCSNDLTWRPCPEEECTPVKNSDSQRPGTLSTSEQVLQSTPSLYQSYNCQSFRGAATLTHKLCGSIWTHTLICLAVVNVLLLWISTEEGPTEPPSWCPMLNSWNLTLWGSSWQKPTMWKVPGGLHYCVTGSTGLKRHGPMTMFQDLGLGCPYQKKAYKLTKCWLIPCDYCFGQCWTGLNMECTCWQDTATLQETGAGLQQQQQQQDKLFLYTQMLDRLESLP